MISRSATSTWVRWVATHRNGIHSGGEKIGKNLLVGHVDLGVDQTSKVTSRCQPLRNDVATGALRSQSYARVNPAARPADHRETETTDHLEGTTRRQLCALCRARELVALPSLVSLSVFKTDEKARDCGPSR
jgi:hypothetical protein